MGTKTIGQLTLAPSLVDADLVEVEIAASGLSRKVPRSTLIGATLTGGGAIATGGFTLTVPATGVAGVLQNGIFNARLTDGSGNTAAVFSTNLGTYSQLAGGFIKATGKFQLNSGTSGLVGADGARLTLPFAARSTTNYFALGLLLGMRTTGMTDSGYFILRVDAGNDYATIWRQGINESTPEQVIVSDIFSSNQTWYYDISYHVWT